MRLRCFVPVVAFCLASSLAHADSFNFNVVGSAGGFSGSGTFTAVSNSNGSYVITDITGSGVTGLIAPSQFQFNDNLFFPGGTSLLDINGLSFTDVMENAAYDVNIFYDASLDSYETILQDSDGNTAFLPTTFEVSAVTPEPSGIALIGTGLCGIAGVMRKRFV